MQYRNQCQWCQRLWIKRIGPGATIRVAHGCGHVGDRHKFGGVSQGAGAYCDKYRETDEPREDVVPFGKANKKISGSKE